MTETSDVDVVVEFTQPDLLTLIGIQQELEELLHLLVGVGAISETDESFPKEAHPQGGHLCLIAS